MLLLRGLASDEQQGPCTVESGAGGPAARGLSAQKKSLKGVVVASDAPPVAVRTIWRWRPLLLLIRARGRMERRELLEIARREGWAFHDVAGARQVRMTLRGLRARGVIAYSETEVWSTGQPTKRRRVTGCCAPGARRSTT